MKKQKTTIIRKFMKGEHPFRIIEDDGIFYVEDVEDHGILASASTEEDAMEEFRETYREIYR